MLQLFILLISAVGSVNRSANKTANEVNLPPVDPVIIVPGNIVIDIDKFYIHNTQPDDNLTR